MKVSLLSLILILFLKCNSEIQENFSLKIDSPNKKIKINDSINLNVINKNNIEIDSIHFFLNEMKIDQTYTLKNISTGENKIKVIVYQNKQETILNQKIIIFSKNPPKLYSYKIINEFPHDQQAYTQGLEFDGDELYESTGLNGKSSLRKVSFENGEIKKNVPLNQSYFGEGLTIINNKIISEGSNKVTSTNDPTAHGEIVAIREACLKLSTFNLSGCELYSTCEPCPMCLSAIYWSHIDRVFYANTRDDARNIDFDDNFIYSEINKKIEDRKILVNKA